MYSGAIAAKTSREETSGIEPSELQYLRSPWFSLRLKMMDFVVMQKLYSNKFYGFSDFPTSSLSPFFLCGTVGLNNALTDIFKNMCFPL